MELSSHQLADMSGKSPDFIQRGIKELVEKNVLWDDGIATDGNFKYILNFEYGWVGTKQQLNHFFNEIVNDQLQALAKYRKRLNERVKQ